ncbi:hypothetical protein OVA24_16610 [Luteolibacter sp. SL250]|uniref:hypothetical protein n=1 Tax=Luteolibacter sp. SL250 TaxID=2995170 RepID=UPI0022712064|nr:hypothetical protein [Luteolibacter sp. SL250]WAC18854.1 hypothetical protein OVA24_16610 [Luteolibacter sp. SL250]
MSAILTSPIPLVVCHCCKAPAELFQHRDGGYVVECSDSFDCLQWPMTDVHPTPEEAATAWNEGHTH